MLLGAAVFVSLDARGHESGFYPSFYPQEIRIETLDPAAAAASWATDRVHAFVGGDPFAGRAVAANAVPVESLHSYLVLTFDAASGPYAVEHGSATARCTAAGRFVQTLAPGGSKYVAHAYPITPYHADYLEQFDLARRAQAQRSEHPVPADGPALRIRAIGSLASTLVPAQSSASGGGWDATLEEVDIDRLDPRGAPGPGGWLGSPWAKQGWFQTRMLYARHLHDTAAVALTDAAYRRLTTGDYRSLAERIGLERALVATLVAGCERVVVGYTLRHEYFDTEYEKGVENVGYDSQSGLLAAIFPRTVKLKDFPWNGWARFAVASAPAAAWNPIAGFGDAFGKLLWHTVSDQALFPAPYGGSWISNRVRIEPGKATAAANPIAMPKDAVRPEPGTGTLRPVGTRAFAQQHLRYSAVTSLFQDGTQGGFADLIYPYIFAARWEAPGGRAGFDPVVAQAIVPVTQWLAGFKLVAVTTESRDFGEDMQFHYQVPVIDVYLKQRSDDPWEAAAAAPPWSTLPWQLIVLMEEAVDRGIAAFSESEAKRRGVPWLDLVRDRETGVRLAALVEEFRRDGYRPAALKGLVSVDQARERWTALAAFHAQYGHFLDTNGPYRLQSWSPGGVVLEVFRDLSYPQGVGSLDRFAIPLRAYATTVEDRGSRLEIGAEVETVSRFQRSYEIERAPLGPGQAIADGDPPQCRYVIVAPNGNVLAGNANPGGDGRYTVPLEQLRVPGIYKIMLALYVGGNSMNPEVKLVEHRVPVAPTRPADKPPRQRTSR